MKHYKFFIILVLLIGLLLRFYHIEFGLPHSFYADEPEFSEPAIKYTYEIVNIVKNNDYYKLIPTSFVYGTFPVYLLTVKLMAFSKFLNLANIAFDKTTLFIFMRVITAVISFGVVVFTWLLARKMFGVDKKILLLTTLLSALNWKLIVHAHYVNADIILTLLLLVSFFVFYLYSHSEKPDKKWLIISAGIFGLAVGTKITALISLPMFAYVIFKKKDYYGILGFAFTALITFIITNPFSILFFNEFTSRIFSMLTKEGGMVFDSVNYSPFKYILALESMLTLPALLAAIYGIIIFGRFSRGNVFGKFLIGNILIYIIFYSVQSRRVDRWLLPLLPIFIIYASYGLIQLSHQLKSKLFIKLVFASVFIAYLFNPAILLTQFKRWTPKSEAYLWAKDNLPPTSLKLAYTEEGLDPLNKLPLATVKQHNVYVSEGAEFFYPEDPMLYDYVIISSRPMENYKRKEVAQKYPEYAKRWQNFENTLENPQYFELIKDFTLSKPNLIPLSDVFVYKRKN